MNLLNTIPEESWKSEKHNSFAGFGHRLLAFVVDIVVFLPVVMISLAISWFGKFNVPSEVISMLFILYRILFHYKKGATIGKKQSDLRVEKHDGSRISLTQSILREFAPIFSIVTSIILSQIPSTSITQTYKNQAGDLISVTRPVSDWQFYLLLFSLLIMIIDVVWIFTNKEKKALHDIIAKTYCTKK